MSALRSVADRARDLAGAYPRGEPREAVLEVADALTGEQADLLSLAETMATLTPTRLAATLATPEGEAVARVVRDRPADNTALCDGLRRLLGSAVAALCDALDADTTAARDYLTARDRLLRWATP